MCSVTNIVQTRQRCNLVLLVDWLTGCGSPRVLRSWFAGCWLCTQLQINTRTRDVVHTKKLLSTLNLVELMCCLCIENTARTSMVPLPSCKNGIRFQFQFQRSTDTLVHFLVRVLSLITSGPFLFFGGSVLQIDCKLFLRGIF